MALAPLVFHTSLPALERGQRWRFGDGSEGIVASANTVSVTVYVGPRSLTIPVGDLCYAFDGASLVVAETPATPAAPTQHETTSDDRPLGEPTASTASSVVAPGEELPAVAAELASESASAPAVAELPDASTMSAPSSQHGRAGRASGPRRDRKRDAQI